MSIKTNPITARQKCKNMQLNAIKFNAHTHVYMNDEFYCTRISNTMHRIPTVFKNFRQMHAD